MNKRSAVAVAKIEALAGCLSEVAGKAQEKIGERRAGLGAIDVERAIERRIRILVDLISMKLAAELQRVRADDLG